MLPPSNLDSPSHSQTTNPKTLTTNIRFAKKKTTQTQPQQQAQLALEALTKALDAIVDVIEEKQPAKKRRKHTHSASAHKQVDTSVAAATSNVGCGSSFCLVSFSFIFPSFLLSPCSALRPCAGLSCFSRGPEHQFAWFESQAYGKNDHG